MRMGFTLSHTRLDSGNASSSGRAPSEGEDRFEALAADGSNCYDC